MSPGTWCVITALCLLCACPRPSAPPPAAPAPPPAAPAAPGPTAGEPPEVPRFPTTWTDPRVVAELAKDCAFSPLSLPEAERVRRFGHSDFEGGPGERNPLACGPAEDQSCVYDPCFQESEEECKPRCARACESCAAACISSCQTCRAACKDDACRAACAAGCARCHEGCNEASDRCGSATCTAEYKKCRVKLRADWRRLGCKATCKRYRSCTEKGCTAKQGCDMELCPGEGSMGINPEAPVEE